MLPQQHLLCTQSYSIFSDLGLKLNLIEKGKKNSNHIDSVLAFLFWNSMLPQQHLLCTQSLIWKCSISFSIFYPQQLLCTLNLLDNLMNYLGLLWLIWYCGRYRGMIVCSGGARKYIWGGPAKLTLIYKHKNLWCNKHVEMYKLFLVHLFHFHKLPLKKDQLFYSSSLFFCTSKNQIIP